MFFWKWARHDNTNRILSSESRNKRLQCYYWWINVCDQPVRNNLRTYNNIRKLETGQGDDYTTACLPNYNYFKNYYNNIAIDLRKQ